MSRQIANERIELERARARRDRKFGTAAVLFGLFAAIWLILMFLLCNWVNTASAQFGLIAYALLTFAALLAVGVWLGLVQRRPWGAVCTAVFGVFVGIVGVVLLLPIMNAPSQVIVYFLLMGGASVGLGVAMFCLGVTTEHASTTAVVAEPINREEANEAAADLFGAAVSLSSSAPASIVNLASVQLSQCLHIDPVPKELLSRLLNLDPATNRIAAAKNACALLRQVTSAAWRQYLFECFEAVVEAAKTDTASANVLRDEVRKHLGLALARSPKFKPKKESVWGR